MEFLTGEDMSALRNRARLLSPSGLIPVPIVAYLCSRILAALSYMHSKGFVHRDVKPSNFVRRSAKCTEFCVVDFGLTKQVKILLFSLYLFRCKQRNIQYLDRDGNVRPEKADKADFRGTTQYASPLVHIFGADQSPRDDLFSLFFVLTDMICGQVSDPIHPIACHTLIRCR